MASENGSLPSEFAAFVLAEVLNAEWRLRMVHPHDLTHFSAIW